MPRPLGRRRWLLPVLIALVVAVVAAGVVVRVGLTDRLPRVDRTYTAVVGAGGYDETFDHGVLGRIAEIRVVVPAGAVPAGTGIRTRVVDDRAAIGMDPGGTPLIGTGLAADVDLDDGVRPSAPLTVEMSTRMVEGRTVVAATRTGDGLAPAPTVRVAEARRVTYRATVDGSGPVAFYRVDVDRLWSDVADRWNAATTGRRDAPDCAEASVAVGGRRYSTGPARQVDGVAVTDREEQSVVPCLGAADDDMVVDLYGTGSTGLRIRPESDPAGMTLHGRARNSAADDPEQELAESLAGRGYVLPGFATRVRYPKPVGQIVLTDDPAPALVLALVPVLARTTAELGGRAGRVDTDCLLAHLDRTDGDRTASTLVAGMVDCARAAGGKQGPGAMAAAVLGAIVGELGSRAEGLDGMREAVEGRGRSVVLIPAEGEAMPTTITVDPDAGHRPVAPNPPAAGGEQVIPADLGVVGGGVPGASSRPDDSGGAACAETGAEHGNAGSCTSSLAEFRSPADSIACQIGGTFAGAFGGDFRPRVACVVSGWTGSAPTPDCSAFGNISALPYAAAISSSGRAAQGVCAGGVPFAVAAAGAGGPVLPYGSRTQIGSVYCVSRPTGMTCGDTSSGQHFTISAQQILLNGAPAG